MGLYPQRTTVQEGSKEGVHLVFGRVLRARLVRPRILLNCLVNSLMNHLNTD